MPATVKRTKTWKEKLPPGKSYAIDDALKLVKEFATAKFNESVDVSVNLGVDATKSDQQVRGSTVMPHGTGKTVRVAVFTQGKNAEAAKAAGADIVGFEDLAEKVKVDISLLREFVFTPSWRWDVLTPLFRSSNASHGCHGLHHRNRC